MASRSGAGIGKGADSNVNPVYKAVRNVTSYVGNVGREFRDVPTAVGTGLWAKFDRENSGPANKAKTIANSVKAGNNTDRQIADYF
jgi:hypothetical protein